MTKAWKRHAIEMAVCLAVMMHMLLFIAIRPADGNGLAGRLVPPETHYLGKPSGQLTASGSDVRSVWSPVLFSLPSKLGFSRSLMQDNLHTRLTFAQPSETENFLEIDPASRSAVAQLVPVALMLTAGDFRAPQPPAGIFQPLDNRPPARRVHMASELKERLVGGIVLPPELSSRGSAAWEVHADISISKQGAVRHVFLEQPLEAAALNQAIVQLLHGLRFKPGDGPIEGHIEIHSPAITSGKEASP